MTDWIISDTHLGHNNVVKYENRNFCLQEEDLAALTANGGVWHKGSYRGEGSSDHVISSRAMEIHDSTIINEINARVKPSDTLFHLGDFVCGIAEKQYVRRVSEYRERINCEHIVLVFGNHDLHKEINEPDLIRQCGFQEYHVRLCHPIPSLGLGKKAKERCLVMDHYPIQSWMGSHRGWLHAYGHSHGSSESWRAEHMPHHRSRDVGVDVIAREKGYYGPIELDEVIYDLTSKEGHATDHHIPTNYDGPTERDLAERVNALVYNRKR